MIKSLSLPSILPVQALFRPILFAALGLHALVLFIPFPQEQKKPPENKEAPVKITQLPTTRSGAQTKLTPKVTVPKATKPSLPKINRPSSSPTILRAATPSPLDSVSSTDPATPAAVRGSNLNRSENVANPFQDFPHFAPSTTDCFQKGLGENCRIASSDLTSVASFYQSEPLRKGFTVQPAGGDAGTKFFEVSKGGTTLYLSLFSDDSTTVVLLSPERVSDLATLKGAVSPPAEYVELLGSILPEGDRDSATGNVATAEQFEQPQFFFSQLPTEAEARNGVPAVPMAAVDSAKFGIGQAPGAFYSTYLEAELNTTFEGGVKKLAPYGGGDLYQLKKGSTTIYMSLVPMKGQTGTIVVTWLKDPTK